MDEADQPVPSQKEVEHRPPPLGWVSELVDDPSDTNMGNKNNGRLLTHRGHKHGVIKSSEAKG